MDGELQGTKILEFGPVRVAVSTRKRLEMILLEGELVVGGRLAEESVEKEVDIRITMNSLKVRDLKGNNSFRF